MFQIKSDFQGNLSAKRKTLTILLQKLLKVKSLFYLTLLIVYYVFSKVVLAEVCLEWA